MGESFQDYLRITYHRKSSSKYRIRQIIMASLTVFSKTIDCTYHLNSKVVNIELRHEIPTMWYVRPAKPQISLHIWAVWSEPLLVTSIFFDCWATEWTTFGVSKLNRKEAAQACLSQHMNVKIPHCWRSHVAAHFVMPSVIKLLLAFSYRP